MGTRLISIEPPDTVRACFETVITVWLCMWDKQEHVCIVR